MQRSGELLQATIDEQAAPRPPEFSDIALAARFVEERAMLSRHVAALNTWYHFDGTRWVEDGTHEAFDISRRICKAAAAEVLQRDDLSERDRKRIATGIASARTVAAVLQLARADRRLASTVDQWDADPWALNTPTGSINLRDGKSYAHDWADCHSKSTTVGPRLGVPTAWLGFLEDVTGGDAALLAYLQRLAGYCLTGITREHSLHFLWGIGGNGKSTFLNVLREALGDYATVASADTFVESHGDRHPVDLAMLWRARLVLASETEDGRQWAASRIKSLTGGDPISARKMRQDFFTFVPRFKLLIAGNHKPGLRNVDEAMRRRMHLIPFNVTIPEGRRDKHLQDRLLRELPEILAWMIEGCLQWQDKGLAPPPCVREATDQYLDDNDVVGTWLAECTVAEFGGFETIAALHTSYHRWAEATGERFLASKKLAAALDARGVQRHRKNAAKGFQGLRIVMPGDLLSRDAANSADGHLSHEVAS